MTSTTLLRGFGWLYAAAGVFSMGLVLQDIRAYGWNAPSSMYDHTIAGAALIVAPSVLFSFVMFGFARKPDAATVRMLFVISLLAILYLVPRHVAGFYYWYLLGDSELLDTWVRHPVVWAELAVCLALGALVWLRKKAVWLLALALAAGVLLPELGLLPMAFALHRPLSFGWHSLGVHYFGIAWLVAFMVLVTTQLMDARTASADVAPA